MIRSIALATAAAALVGASSAAAAVEVKPPDTSRYPEIRLTVVTSQVTRTPPTMRENGRRVVGLKSENLGKGKSVVLAVDRSRSMQGSSFAHAVAAARAFVAAKPASDRIAVVGFGSRAVQLTRFSSATIDADLALRGLAVDGREGTALNDSIAMASRALEAESRPARVLIVLTDGRDVSSSTTAQSAIAAARDAGVSVYAIGIEGPQFSPGYLQQLSRTTGGSYYSSPSAEAVRAAYAAIAAELRRSWQLRYLTAARPGERLTLAAAARGAGVGSVQVRLPGAAQAGPADPSLLPQGAYRSAWGSIFIGLAVGALLLMAAALAESARKGSWLRGRLAPHLGSHRGAATQKHQGERFATGVALLRATEAALGHLKVWHKVHGMLERADLPLRTVEFLYIAAGAGFLFGLLAAVTGAPSLVILAAFAAGAGIPFGFVWFKARRRTRAFDDQLPDLLLTVAAALKAGHSFKQALQSVVEEGQPPASKEFARALAEMRLGRPVEEALGEMAERVGSKNLEFVITAVTIQNQVGGSLAGLFDMVADAVRQRQQFARKIRALTAMGRGSAYVLIGLPFFIAFALTVLHREFMAPLYHTSTGHKLIGVMLVMMTIGSLILKKIVSFRG